MKVSSSAAIELIAQQIVVKHLPILGKYSYASDSCKNFAILGKVDLCG